MDCPYHINHQISLICIAPCPHKCQCQRKLCVDCLNKQGVGIEHIVSINQFLGMVNTKLKDDNLDQTSELNIQRMNFKIMLSQTERMMQQIWEGLSQQIRQIYDMIEMKNRSYFNIINENTNPAELSYTDLEKLVQILEGNAINLWNSQKNVYLKKLEMIKNYLGQEFKTFNEKIKKEMTEILSQEFKPHPRIKIIQELDLVSEIVSFELLAEVNNIEEQLSWDLEKIIEMEKKNREMLEKEIEIKKYIEMEEKYIEMEKKYLEMFMKKIEMEIKLFELEKNIKK